ncbi:MAG: hypothetical protein WCP12_12975 [bacterium]
MFFTTALSATTAESFKESLLDVRQRIHGSKVTHQETSAFCAAWILTLTRIVSPDTLSTPAFAPLLQLWFNSITG